MDASILLEIIFFVSLLTQTTSHAETNSCQPSKCNLKSSEIRHPFRIQGLHPQHCGLPGFQLFCQQEKTSINFPDYGDLAVKSIFYDSKRLELVDPRNCVHEVFLNLNLSRTPFRYYHVLKQYKYIKCSSKIPSPLVQFVPCLSTDDSVHGNYVYTVELSFAVPGYCTTVKSVGIPFSYSSYLSDDSFGLELTWDSAGEDENIEAWRIQTYFKASAKIIALIFMVGILLHAKIIRRCMGSSGDKIQRKYDEIEVDIISRGQYEALRSPMVDDIDIVCNYIP
ncbi:putative RING-H2 finger protein ATL21A [Henckelia pumila]|uniref:putative RING-H2 finger protein ATL21A n=1 Tax=Henckelia pumila TaxID=405737 RepID=UPI003C6DEACE